MVIDKLKHRGNGLEDSKFDNNKKPDIPVGKAFDQFFANGEWKSFKSTDNQLVVEFNGDCTWYNAPAKMKVQFVINGNEFTVYHVGINDIPMNELDSFGIVAKILEEYKN